MKFLPSTILKLGAQAEIAQASETKEAKRKSQAAKLKEMIAGAKESETRRKRFLSDSNLPADGYALATTNPFKYLVDTKH